MTNPTDDSKNEALGRVWQAFVKKKKLDKSVEDLDDNSDEHFKEK